jgi:hypothetical protein
MKRSVNSEANDEIRQEMQTRNDRQQNGGAGEQQKLARVDKMTHAG